MILNVQISYHPSIYTVAMTKKENTTTLIRFHT